MTALLVEHMPDCTPLSPCYSCVLRDWLKANEPRRYKEIVERMLKVSNRPQLSYDYYLREAPHLAVDLDNVEGLAELEKICSEIFSGPVFEGHKVTPRQLIADALKDSYNGLQ